MTDERTVQAREQLKAAQRGAWLLRNNSGAFKDARGVQVRYGLGNISKKWDTVRYWRAALNQFEILWGDRIRAAKG